MTLVISSPSLRGQSLGMGSSEAVKKSVQTYVPLGRAGEPQDIEGLVVFLASRASNYVNGVTIPLDGGYLAAL